MKKTIVIIVILVLVVVFFIPKNIEGRDKCFGIKGQSKAYCNDFGSLSHKRDCYGIKYESTRSNLVELDISNCYGTDEKPRVSISGDDVNLCFKNILDEKASLTYSLDCKGEKLETMCKSNQEKVFYPGIVVEIHNKLKESHNEVKVCLINFTWKGNNSEFNGNNAFFINQY